MDVVVQYTNILTTPALFSPSLSRCPAVADISRCVCPRCADSVQIGMWSHLDKVLARSGPLEGEDFPASEEVWFGASLRKTVASTLCSVHCGQTDSGRCACCRPGIIWRPSRFW